MSQSWSISQKRPYGLKQVCRVWRLPRSTEYARRKTKAVGDPPQRRGPRPALREAEILALVREYLATTPWTGEGHRKVYAWIRYVKGLKIAKDRVWRIMRDNRLLSPRRQSQGEVNLHDGKITTVKPDLIWGTDGFKVRTLKDGWVWGFLAVDHCHGEIMGLYAAKRGDAFAALQPIAMGLSRVRGGVAHGVGNGIAVREDHGAQYMSATYRKQAEAWGMSLTYAFVGEPETNGVAERMVRTLKEQVIYGRVIEDLEDLRQRLKTFMRTYNSMWRLEKNRYLTPNEARQQHAKNKAA